MCAQLKTGTDSVKEIFSVPGHGCLEELLSNTLGKQMEAGNADNSRQGSPSSVGQVPTTCFESELSSDGYRPGNVMVCGHGMTPHVQCEIREHHKIGLHPTPQCRYVQVIPQPGVCGSTVPEG